MEAVQTIRERNQAVEWGRMLAAVCVVFLHVPLPGKTGWYISCLARTAVPFFFLVSGYYSFGSDQKRLIRRIGRLAGLNLAATLLYILWGCAKSRYYGGGAGDYFRMIFPDWKPVRDLLLLQVNPFAGHLWYLAALLLCQLILLGYTRCFRGKRVDNRILYGVSGALLAVFFWLSTVRPGSVHYFYYRNGWLPGLPLFSLGMFLREHDGGRKDGRALAIAGAGVLLNLYQCRRFGTTELPVGALLTAAAMALLLAGHPELPSRFMGKPAGRLGTVSTAVYVTHLLVLEAYETFLLEGLARRLGNGEPWLRPLIVLGISLAAAVVWERVDWLAKRRKKAL